MYIMSNHYVIMTLMFGKSSANLPCPVSAHTNLLTTNVVESWALSCKVYQSKWYSVQCAVYNIQCTVYSVQFTVYTPLIMTRCCLKLRSLSNNTYYSVLIECHSFDRIYAICRVNNLCCFSVYSVYVYCITSCKSAV